MTKTRIEKISVAITAEQNAKIKAAVQRGEYATSSEVVRAALREWEIREELRRLDSARIAKLWDEGLASGPAIAGPPAMERLRAKYVEMEQAELRRARPETKARRRSPKVA